MAASTPGTNAAAARIPENYFLANPDLQGGADLTTNNGRTKYNSLQVELRRRLSQGLQFQTSYVFGNAQTSQFETFRRPTFYIRDTGAEGDLTHAFKANVVYDLPFGQGRRFGGNAVPQSEGCEFDGHGFLHCRSPVLVGAARGRVGRFSTATLLTASCQQPDPAATRPTIDAILGHWIISQA